MDDRWEYRAVGTNRPSQQMAQSRTVKIVFHYNPLKKIWFEVPGPASTPPQRKLRNCVDIL
jgi:hypothetical protein